MKLNKIFMFLKRCATTFGIKSSGLDDKSLQITSHTTAKNSIQYQESKSTSFMRAEENSEISSENMDSQPQSEEISFEYLKKLSEEGIAYYQTDLANCYFYGLFNTTIDVEKGMYWLKKAVRGNDPMAIHNLATFYLNGTFVNRDINKAVSLFEKSSSLGLIRSINDLGAYYESINDYLSAANFYLKAAETNPLNPISGLALSNLAMLYINKKIDGGDNQGFECFKKAFERNSVYGYYGLALCYFQGIGVERDLIRSARLLIQLKKYIDSPAEQISDKTLEDMTERTSWLALRFYILSFKEVQSNNYDNSKLFREVAFVYNIPSAYYQFILNTIPLNGSGDSFHIYYDKVSGYINTPFLWSIKSKISITPLSHIKETTYGASKNDPEELCNKGLLYFFGVADYNGCVGTQEQAMQLFIKSAALGYGAARYWIGVCYDEGIGADMDKNQAAYWFSELLNDKEAEYPKDIILDSAYRLANIFIKDGSYFGTGINMLFELMKDYGHHYSALSLCRYACKHNYKIPGTDFDINVLIQTLNMLKYNQVGEACVLLGDIYNRRGENDKALNTYFTAFCLGQSKVLNALEKLDFWRIMPKVI